MLRTVSAGVECCLTVAHVDGLVLARSAFHHSINYRCNARRMAETAAHLVEAIFPPLPVRQWVLSVPKRLRYFLQHDSQALGAVLHSEMRIIAFVNARPPPTDGTESCW